VALSAVLVAFTTAACGGSSSSSSKTSSTAASQSATTSTSATSASTPATATTAAPSAQPTKATSPTVTSGPVRVTLTGQSHTPIAGKPWNYTVRVTDAAGHPLSGTVETDFVFDGLGVVGRESPPVHPLKGGVLHDNVTFPPSALGHPLMLVTVVHTAAGSVAAGWPVNVSQ
jgi:hypothetical protein